MAGKLEFCRISMKSTESSGRSGSPCHVRQAQHAATVIAACQLDPSTNPHSSNDGSRHDQYSSTIISTWDEAAECNGEGEGVAVGWRRHL